MRRCSLIAIAFLLCFSAHPVAATGRPLRVYGPGGPHHVLEECADLFEARHGIAVEVVRALPEKLVEGVRSDGDLYYGGAEYMLYDFDRQNPGLIDTETAEFLHPRRIGIVVRKGNPHGIRTPEDLLRPGLRLLDVKLEEMRRFQGGGRGRNSNIRHHAFTGQNGVDAWRRQGELDAWVTYRSWHRVLAAESDFIEIPGAEALRYVPVAVTRHSANREAALGFIDFLKSPEARAIFLEHGWD